MSDHNDTDAAIRAAEKSGDWRKAMALKNQKLAALIHAVDQNGHLR